MTANVSDTAASIAKKGGLGALARFAGPALILWTLLVWGSRIRNVIDDAELNGFDRKWRLAVAASFLALAIGSGLLMAMRRPLGQQLLVGLATLGIVWWPIRGIQTLVADFSVAFKIVHTVLAAVTVALGVLVIRRWRLAQFGD